MCDLFLPARPGCGLLARLDFEDVRHPTPQADTRAGDAERDDPVDGDLALDVGGVRLALDHRVAVGEGAAGRVHAVRALVPAPVLAGNGAGDDTVVHELLHELLGPDAAAHDHDDERHDQDLAAGGEEQRSADDGSRAAEDAQSESQEVREEEHQPDANPDRGDEDGGELRELALAGDAPRRDGRPRDDEGDEHTRDQERQVHDDSSMFGALRFCAQPFYNNIKLCVSQYFDVFLQ